MCVLFTLIYFLAPIVPNPCYMFQCLVLFCRFVVVSEVPQTFQQQSETYNQISICRFQFFVLLFFFFLNRKSFSKYFLTNEYFLEKAWHVAHI